MSGEEYWWFYIMPELPEKDVELIDAKIQEVGAEWWTVWKRYGEVENNLDSSQQIGCCVQDDMFWVYNVLYFVKWAFESFLIYLMVLLIFFCFYKYKKYKNPLKNAFKRTRLLWVVIFISPIVLVFIRLIFNR